MATNRERLERETFIEHYVTFLDAKVVPRAMAGIQVPTATEAAEWLYEWLIARGWHHPDAEREDVTYTKDGVLYPASDERPSVEDDETNETWIERRNRDPEIKRMFDEEKAKLEADELDALGREINDYKEGFDQGMILGSADAAALRAQLTAIRADIQEAADMACSAIEMLLCNRLLNRIDHITGAAK